MTGTGGTLGPEPPKPDPVEEADLESFPASDPPPWSGAIAGGAHDGEDAETEDAPADGPA